MEQIKADNYEHIHFESADFPFNCFFIANANTLPHWHNHFEIVHPVTGSCEIHINGDPYTCHQGDLLIVPPGNLHSIFPDGPCDYYAIVIGDTLFSQASADPHLSELIEPFMFNGHYNPLKITADHPDQHALQMSMKIMIEYNRQRAPHYQAAIKINLCLFFLRLSNGFPDFFNLGSHKPGSANMIKDVLAYLQIHYNEKLTIPSVSSLFHLSDQHFSRLFKAYTGRTFVEYLTLLRLEQARRLIIYTDMPITRIPDRTGFCNSNYFSRVYKKQYGRRPSDDR